MIKVASQILKKSQVKFSGTQKITYDPTQTGPRKPPATAKILRREDGCAVIQVICGCGEEIQLRCAYGNGEEQQT